MAECAHVDQIKVDVPESRRGMRGVPGDRRDVGRAQGVSRVRPRRLLRLVAGDARDQALPPDRARDHELGDAGRFLVLVLRRRGVVLDGSGAGARFHSTHGGRQAWMSPRPGAAVPG